MAASSGFDWSVSTIIDRLAQHKFLRSHVGTPFFTASRFLWRFVPNGLIETAPLRQYGALLQHLSRLRVERAQSSWTCFARNRAEMHFMADLAKGQPDGAVFSVAVLGCSSGAEAYSAAFSMRDSIDRIRLRILASDISEANIESARAGLYMQGGIETAQLSEDEKQELFEPAIGGELRVRDRWRAPIEWAVVDAFLPGLAAEIGQHDLVIANKFLCHMPPDMARRCLRNIAPVIEPGGCLIVSGVDLDVRAEIVQELGLTPDIAAIESLHNGDRTLRDGWPFDYWGLEPLNKNRRDWPYRYGVAFWKAVGTSCERSLASIAGHDRPDTANSSSA